MKTWCRYLLAYWFISLAGLASIVPAAQADEALLSALRDGGHVIYFRHARTDWSQSDRDRSRLDDCATQRNLSAEGREQSRAIGAAFAELGIPVGSVLSSAYCRCTEMAELAFGEFRVSEAVTSVFLQDQALRDERTVALRELLATLPEQGNTVLISHMANLSAARGVSLAEGEAAIYRPDGNGGSELVGRVRAGEWSTLAAIGEMSAVDGHARIGATTISRPQGLSTRPSIQCHRSPAS